MSGSGAKGKSVRHTARHGICSVNAWYRVSKSEVYSVGGFLNRRFKWRFWVLLPPRARVPRAGARNTPMEKLLALLPKVGRVRRRETSPPATGKSRSPAGETPPRAGARNIPVEKLLPFLCDFCYGSRDGRSGSVVRRWYQRQRRCCRDSPLTERYRKTSANVWNAASSFHSP